ncbi:MAG: putative exported protein [Deltaproteobacteria bacterium]|nr:putative exported protein [Deltaproteobacteria bacterium]
MKHTRSRRLFLYLAAIFVLISVGTKDTLADPPSAIGVVQKAAGAVIILRQEETLSAKIGLEIYQNDTLRTGPDGSIGVAFNDDTLLSLGPESVLVIDEYVFAPGQGKYSLVVRMLKGTAAYLSGLISKLAPESARFKTPTASVGIRGTKFVARVEGDL